MFQCYRANEARFDKSEATTLEPMTETEEADAKDAFRSFNEPGFFENYFTQLRGKHTLTPQFEEYVRRL
jgi:hypothetical protein